MLTKSQETILKFFKTPFSEEDAQEIVNSENAIKSLTEVTIIWSMVEAAKILGEYYEGAEEMMLSILRGDEYEVVIKEENEEEEETFDL